MKQNNFNLTQNKLTVLSYNNLSNYSWNILLYEYHTQGRLTTLLGGLRSILTVYPAEGKIPLSKKGLVWFYGISTFVGYLIPNPFFVNNQFYFKQFSLARVHC